MLSDLFGGHDEGSKPNIVDLSQDISDGMPVFPGDQPVQLCRTHQYAQDGYTNHRWVTSMHVGTHLDTPMHMSEDARLVKDIPLSRLVGPAVLLDVRTMAETGTIHWQSSFPKDLPSILILWTGWDRYYGSQQYYDHPELTLAFAQAAHEGGVRLLAMDMPSPDRNPFPVHKWLFARDVLIVENLTNVGALSSRGRIGFAAIPLKIQADGSPIRAFGWSEG